MNRILPLSAALAALMLVSCQDHRYESIEKDRIIGAWGVSNDTYSFGEYDSLYYAITPVRNIADSIYFNGNYTDSYYSADSTRVTLRYTTSDSIEFNIDRRYTVEVNPKYLVLYARAEGDTAAGNNITLLLSQDPVNGNLFRCGPDKDFTSLLATGSLLLFNGTNASASGEPQGGQNYEFKLESDGFREAMELADSLNAHIRPGVFKDYHGTLHHNIFDELFNKHPDGDSPKAHPAKELPAKKPISNDKNLIR